MHIKNYIKKYNTIPEFGVIMIFCLFLCLLLKEIFLISAVLLNLSSNYPEKNYSFKMFFYIVIIFHKITVIAYIFDYINAAWVTMDYYYYL